MAFIQSPEVKGGERATASLADGWESEIGAISEVLAELAPCERPVRSTRIRGVVTMPGVHSYGKGRAGDGLISATWVTGTEPALVPIVGHRLQLRHMTPFFRDTTVPLALLG